MLRQNISALDHIICGVSDLAAARKTFTSLGFVLSPVGDHAGYGSHNQCVVFPHHYLELFTFYDRTAFPMHPMIPLVDRIGEHVLGVAYATGDAEAAHAALQEAGLSVPHPVFRQARHMKDDQGRVYEGDVAVGHLPPSLQPTMFSFVCQHFNRETMWRQEWIEHPNKINGLRDARLYTPDTATYQATKKAFTALFESAVNDERDDRFSVSIGPDTLIIEDYNAAVHGFDDGIFAAPEPHAFIGLITLTSPDLDETLRILNAAEPVARAYPDRLIIPARHAHGTVLQIVPA
ncbi:MAG: VOC family protein [Pseudomonadota bacterium]